GFISAGVTSRNFIAKFDKTTGAVNTEWNVNANANANKIGISGNNIYIGGTFSGVNPVLRNYITRFNKTTGVPDTSWNPNPNNIVSTIAITGNEIYIGGTFTALGNTTRNRIAKVDNSTGQPYPGWNANASAQVNIITISGTEIYAGGSFTTIGSSTRNRIAKLNSSTGNAEPWNPNAGNTVQTIAISGNSVYAGGDFTSIGGLTRNRIAKLNNITGLADSTWNPNASAAVNAITVNGDDIYAGGSFTSIGGISKNRLAKLNNTTGAADAAWDPNPSAFINKIVISGEDMYAIGNFSTIGGFSITRLAKLKAATGIVNSAWTVTGSQGFLPNFLFADGSTIYLGGNFSGKINGVISPNIAIFKNEEQTGAGNTVISGSGFTSFNTTTDTTTVSISIDAGAGTGQVNVYKYNDSASNISGTPIYVSGYRWIVQQKGLATPFTGKIKFKLSEIPNEPLGNPENIVVYSRPTPGSGNFSALPTTYDQTAGEITATVTSFSEFIFGSDDLLPVELASFTSTVNGSNVKLQWSTVSEINNSGFEIERKSAAGTEWKKIGNVKGTGNSNEIKNYSYTESGLAGGKYNYRLKQIDYNGNFEYHSLANEVIIGIPSKFMLSQNYPNPFNPVTRINYELPVTNYVSLKVYDIQGKEVMTLVNEVKDAGYYSVTFDAKNLSSGMYFYKLSTDKFSAVKKMVVIK
ncbi:MAG: T9SS type A sorting domain-containing protein, partial [Ignavibacteria bacterium]|nr:T9SS type A sorting domain-containing protein [Ignavibacteria bacterium]